jgi:phosphate transport system protein
MKHFIEGEDRNQSTLFPEYLEVEMDDEVDKMCSAELPRQIELIQKHPEDAGQRLMLLSVCRQLERIGDHASNIAEDVVYLLSGDIIRHGENGLMRCP